MLSLESISAVKVAVAICHIPKIKLKIIRANELENGANEGEDPWISKNVRMEIGNIIESLNISKNLEEKLKCLVSKIVKNILEWAKYHEEILEFPRDNSITFLTPSLFTPRGIIDRKKAAKELLDVESLDMKQRYILACVCCFINDIDTLFKQMTDLDKGMFYDARRQENMKQPEIVKYWTCYQMDKFNKLTNEDLNSYKIKTAVRSGNIAAVDYFLQEIVLGRETDATVEAAMEAIRSWQRKTPVTIDSNTYQNATSDKTNVPRYYFADILCYLLSRMGKGQLIEFLKRDIEDDQYKTIRLKYKKYSRVLECLLNWPYQDYFMKTVAVMWSFLPEWNYALLLILISRKIEDGSQELDSEEKSFDYKRLLREFWCQSHERYKMFVLNNREILCSPDNSIKVGVRLLINLFALENFSDEDKDNIEIILAFATNQLKENIICSEEWRKICINLIKEEKWGILIRFDLDCFFTKEARAKFKKILSFVPDIRLILLRFVQNDKLDSAESFIKWTFLPEREIKKLKRDIIYSDDGMEACISLISNKGKMEAVERFIAWWFSSEQDAKLFKKELIFSQRGIFRCAELIIENKLELSNELIHLCVSSFEEITELKKKIANDFGYTICKRLISSHKIEFIESNQHRRLDRVITFTGGKWEEIEKFITFCFSSEDEISDFKKNGPLKILDIHFDFINSCKWEEAETFFSWLCLSADEVKKLKKETLFYHSEAKKMFVELMHCKEGNPKFVDYGNKDEAIELLLRWYLNDKDTVIEFKDEYKKWYQDFNCTDKVSMLKKLDLIVEQRLKDFDKELD